MENKDGTVTDQTGLGLTFTELCCSECASDCHEAYCLSDERDNKMYFNRKGYLVRTEDPNKCKNILTYDGNNNLIKITDATGRAITLKYSNNRLSQMEDAGGKKVSYTYNSSHKLIKITFICICPRISCPKPMCAG